MTHPIREGPLVLSTDDRSLLTELTLARPSWSSAFSARLDAYAHRMGEAAAARQRETWCHARALRRALDKLVAENRRAVPAELGDAEARQRLKLCIAPTRELVLRRNRFKARVRNEPEHNAIHWTADAAYRMHLGLFQRSLEQLRRSNPGDPHHTDVCAWIDRRDGVPRMPFSFDTCAELWGLDPDYTRRGLARVRQLQAMDDAQAAAFTDRLSRHRWDLIRGRAQSPAALDASSAA